MAQPLIWKSLFNDNSGYCLAIGQNQAFTHRLRLFPVMLFRSLVYFKVSAGVLTAQVIGSANSTTIACAALSHPRTLMGEFNAVQNCMKEALEELGLRSWYKWSPITLTHLLPEVEGGYTNVELRAFREAAMGAGSSQAYLLANHPPLSEDELSRVSEFFNKTVL